MSTIIRQRKFDYKIKDLEENGIINQYKDVRNPITIKTEREKHLQNKSFIKTDNVKIDNYKKQISEMKNNLIYDKKSINTTKTNHNTTKNNEPTQNAPKQLETTINKEKQIETKGENKNVGLKENINEKKVDNQKNNNNNFSELGTHKKTKNNRFYLSRKIFKNTEYAIDQILIDDQEDLGIDTVIKTKTGIKNLWQLNKKGFEINKTVGTKAYKIATSENAKAFYVGTIKNGAKIYRATETAYNKIYIKQKVNSFLKKTNKQSLKEMQRKKITEKMRKKMREKTENLIKIFTTRIKNLFLSFFTKKMAIILFLVIILVFTLISAIMGVTSIFGASGEMQTSEEFGFLEEYLYLLDLNINNQIENAEKTYSADKYIYNIMGQIKTDTSPIYAYIMAKYSGERINEELIRAETKKIHNNLYKLSFVKSTEEVETETEEGKKIETITVLTVSLKVKGAETYLKENMSVLLSDAQQKDYKFFLDLTKTLCMKSNILKNPFPGVHWKSQITSEFGYRVHPISGEYTNHTGVDIGMPHGTEIYACTSGTVKTYNLGDKSYGLYLTITDGEYITIYAHCSEILVKDGDYVNAGDIIAKVGSTGVSTGPHLHLELKIDGKRVDPIRYIEF